MKLTGLTPEQVSLCDRLWACDTAAEVIEMFKTLTPQQRREAASLQQLLIIEHLDSQVNNFSDCKQAANILTKLFTASDD